MEVIDELGVASAGSEPDVRVDDPMDRRVPVEAEDLEVLGPTCKVGRNLDHTFATALVVTLA
eukprot:6378045-Amphidinium_carterae.1